MKTTDSFLAQRDQNTRPVMYVDKYGPRSERTPHQMTLLDLDFVQDRGLLPVKSIHPVKQPVFPDSALFDLFKGKV